MLNKRQKESLLQELQSIQHRTATLIKVIDDMDSEDIVLIDGINEVYSNLFDSILLRQKQRGKKFLSNDEIDMLIDDVKREQGI